MIKSKEIKNTLIKRKNLIKKIKERRITSISPDALKHIEEYLNNNLSNIIPLLNEELTIQGRKTLKKEDATAVLEKIKPKDEFRNWEI